MEILNRPLRALFDTVLAPFRGLDAMVGLTIVSLVVSIGLLWVFKRTSNQDKLADVKRKIHAGLFEVRLFNDDLRAILRAQGEILWHNLSYLRLSAVPLLWILPPLVFVVGQLQFHYTYGGLEIGEQVLLEATLEEDWESLSGNAVLSGGRPRLLLEVPDGIRVDSAPVWSPTTREMTWRLVAEEPGSYDLALELGDRSETKTAVVDDRVLRRSPLRVKGALNQLVYPAEAPLPADSPFEQISLAYPEVEVGVWGFEAWWMIVFFILTIIFAFALRKPMGVTI
jgi:hypothetical protein